MPKRTPHLESDPDDPPSRAQGARGPRGGGAALDQPTDRQLALELANKVSGGRANDHELYQLATNGTRVWPHRYGTGWNGGKGSPANRNRALVAATHDVASW